MAALAEVQIRLGHTACNMARSAAAGPPLVMFHGVTRRWQTFLPIIPALSLRRQILTLDFRGHGRSARAAGQYRVIDYAREAVQFVLEQVHEPAVVYGHSLGAMVAAAVAAEVPELVQAAILEDPPFDTMGCRIAQTRLHSYFSGMTRLAGSNQPIAELARQVAELQFVDPESGHTARLGNLRDPAALRFTAKCLTQLDPDVLAPIVAGSWLEGYDRRKILSRIRRPILLLQADAAAGGMLPDEDAAEIEALIADCTRVKLTGTDHLIHWSRPQETINLVQNFLESFEEPNQHASAHGTP